MCTIYGSSAKPGLLQARGVLAIEKSNKIIESPLLDDVPPLFSMHSMHLVSPIVIFHTIVNLFFEFVLFDIFIIDICTRMIYNIYILYNEIIY